jgi:hypothetical protein
MSKGVFGFVGARNESALTPVGSMCLALCLVSAPAYADTLGGNSGHGWPSWAVGCFESVEDKGTGNVTQMMRNKGGLILVLDPTGVPDVRSCEDTPIKLVIPLHTRRTGSTTITVWAKGGESKSGEWKPTTCKGIRNNNDNESFPTNQVSTTTMAVESLVLESLRVERGNTLLVECQVPVNGAVQSVDWPQ